MKTNHLTVGQLENHLAKLKNKDALVLICEAKPSIDFDNTGLTVAELSDDTMDNEPEDGPGGVYYVLVKGLERTQTLHQEETIKTLEMALRHIPRNSLEWSEGDNAAGLGYGKRIYVLNAIQAVLGRLKQS